MLTTLGIIHKPVSNSDKLNDDDNDDVELADYLTAGSNNINDDSDNDSQKSLQSSAATLKNDLDNNDNGNATPRDAKSALSFRLCSILTAPVSSDSRTQTPSRKGKSGMRNKLSASPSSRPSSSRSHSSGSGNGRHHRHHRSKKNYNRKKQKSPDYHRLSTVSFGTIRRFHEQPPPPLAVLYSNVSELLSPRPLEKTADNADIPRQKVVLPTRSVMPTSAPVSHHRHHHHHRKGSPKEGRRRHRNKAPESSRSVSDVETATVDSSQVNSSSSDDDSTFVRKTQAEDNGEESRVEILRRNRELMLHSGLRRPLERLISPSDGPTHRNNYDPTNRLKPVLNVRPIQATPMPLDSGPVIRLTYADPESSNPLSSLLKVRHLQSASATFTFPTEIQSNNKNDNNNILAHNIREMFLKHFGPPPVTVITTGSSQMRDSIFPVGSSVARPAPLRSGYYYNRVPNQTQRPKTSAAQVTPSRQVGREENPNTSSSPSNNPSPSAGQQHSSTTPNRRSGEQGDDMGDAPDQAGGDGRRPAATRALRASMAGNQQLYYLGSHNGAALVEAPLIQLGWKRVTDKNSDQFRFKWCDVKSAINFPSFREGEQMVNHLPNNQLLTNKLGLLNSLQDYDRQLTQSKKRGSMRLTSFYPETYRLDDRADRELFLQTYKDGEIWICKPTGLNQGIGIHLVRTTEEAKALADDRESKMQQARGQVRQPMTRIVQRYILRPLLLEGRKFDIRCYMLIACTSPWLVLYHQGYIRLSIHHYHPDSPDITVHLTNQYIQKKDSTYKEVKENTAWSMDTFNQYINENFMEAKGLERDWANNTLSKQIQRIIVHIFSAVKNKLSAKVGYFELYGLDFMIDDNMKVYLIEVNTNPSLSVNPKPLGDCIPGIVAESVYLAIECFEKARKGQPLLPLKALDGFNIVFHGQRKTIDFGPGDNQGETEDATESTWTSRYLNPPPRLFSNPTLEATLRRVLSATQTRTTSSATFELRQDLQRFQQQIITRGPTFNNGINTVNVPPKSPKTGSARVPLKYSNRRHQQRCRTAVKEFFTCPPSSSDDESSGNSELEMTPPMEVTPSPFISNSNNNNKKTAVVKPASGIRQVSSNDWERKVSNALGGVSTFRTYNWPAREPISQHVKRRQEVVAAGNSIVKQAWNSASSRPRSVKSSTVVGLPSSDSEDEVPTQQASDDMTESGRRSIVSAGDDGTYPLFKPFRLVIVEDPNISPPPDRTTSVRRTRSLSPVKVGNQLIPPTTNATTTTRTLSPKPVPKAAPAGPPAVTPRPRTVRQTLLTSVATVRVSNNANNGENADGSSSPVSPPSPSDAKRLNDPNGMQSANGLQRQVTFAPMSLPTVRLQLTQVQFPYPVIAGQTIASVSASALGTAGIPVATSPYLTATTRIKTKERKERGN